MTRNLKTLSLALLSVLALSAIGAQGVTAADSHQFKADGQRMVWTGSQVGAHEFTIGAVGTVKCTTATLEGTVDAGAGKTEVDEITVKPNYSGCEFGGQAATVFMNDCAYVYDSDTVEAEGEKYANVTIECGPGISIEIHTVNCTITIGAQLVFVPGTRFTTISSTKIEIDHRFVKYTVQKKRTTPSQPINGCLLFPTGAVGKYVGTTSVECRSDEGSAQANPTTPSGTQDATSTSCSVTEI